MGRDQTIHCVANVDDGELRWCRPCDLRWLILNKVSVVEVENVHTELELGHVVLGNGLTVPDVSHQWTLDLDH